MFAPKNFIKTEAKKSETSKISKNDNAAIQQKKEKANPVTIFVDAAYKGVGIGFKSIIPNVVMAFVLIKALNVTGLMDVIGNVLSPLMGIFGLPGQAGTVLLASILSMGGGVGVAGGLFAEGVLTGANIAILSPAIFLMGSLLQYAGRCLAVIGVKNQPLLFGVSILNGLLAMFIMNILV